jgi:hypothetical protein
VADVLGAPVDSVTPPAQKGTPAKKIQRTGTSVVESIVDSYQRLYSTEREVERRTGQKIAVGDDPYERLTKISARSQYAVEEFQHKTFAPLLRRIAEMSEKLPEQWDSADILKHEALARSSPLVQLFLTAEGPRKIFDLYLIAKHAPHRNAYLEKKSGGATKEGSGVSNAEAAAVVGIFEQHFTPSEISDLWSAVEKATDASLDAWREAGRISKQAYDDLKRDIPYYVPLRGWDESETDEAIDASYTGGLTGDYFSGYKAAKGRKTIAYSPLAYIASMAQSAIIFRENNAAKRLLFELAAKAKQPDLMKVKKIYTVETLDAKGNVTATREVDTDPRRDPAHPLAPNERVVVSATGAKHAIAPYKAKQHEVEVWVGGQKYALEFADEQVAQELNEGAYEVSKLLKVVGRGTKGMAALMTQKNPIFWTKNTLRDVQGAALRLWVLYDGSMAASFLGHVPRAAQVAFLSEFSDRGAALRSGDPTLQKYIGYMEEYRKSGGRVGFMQFMQVEQLRRDVDRAILKSGGLTRGSYISKALRAINGMASVSEDISRLAAFFAARENGRSVAEAASIAKEVTVNFNRRGKYSAAPGALYAFFNATVQAAANHVELFRRRPARATVAAAVHAAMGYFMYSLSAFLLGGDDDDDDLRNLSSYRKYVNLFLPVGNGGFAQFPLSQAWRPFYAIGVAAAQVEHGELSPSEALLGVGEQFFGYSPVEVGSILGVGGNPEQLAPTALLPIIETFITKRNFMGAPLVRPIYDKQTDENTPKHLRGVRTDQLPLWQFLVDRMAGDTPTGHVHYNDGASGLLRLREAGGVDLSPDQLRHLILSYTGGLGVATNDVINLAYTLATRGDFNPNKIPIASGYYSKPAPRYYTDKYYRMTQVYDQFERNLKVDHKTGRIVEYADNPNLPELKYAGMLLKASKISMDEAREKRLKKVFEVWDAGEKRMERVPMGKRSRSDDEARKEVEAIAKEVVKEIEPIFKELGLKY